MTEKEFESLLKARTKSLEYLRTLDLNFLKNHRRDDTEILNRFEKFREASFRALQLFDDQITLYASHFQSHPLSSATKMFLQKEHQNQELLVKELIQLDQDVMKKIEAINIDILRDLKASEKNRATLSKFKSTNQGISGEELDQSL